MNSIPYGKQYITSEDIEAVNQCLTSDFLTQGPYVSDFEQQFAAYTGASYAVAVSNGTAALHLCAMALNVAPGTRVITTPITFAASANCILYCGGEVSFCDIDPLTGLMDLVKLEEMLRAKPQGYYAGVIPVDFAGYPVDLEKLRNIVSPHGMWIIEDACHAPGGYFTDTNGDRQNCGNGNFADLAIFSFHPVKHIATGEGGMITTNNKDLYNKLLTLRTHGITKDPSLMLNNEGGWYYEMQHLGYNYRIPDILCALGISQLSRAEQGMQRRLEIADRYDEAFSDCDTITPLTPAGSYSLLASGVRHAFHLYVIQVPYRKDLYDRLREHGIFTQVHYIPVPYLPYYRQLGFNPDDYPAALEYYQHCLSLPMFPSLSDSEQEFVIGKIKELVS